jgi:hypothetical protein
MNKVILEEKVYCYEDSVKNFNEIVETINELDELEKQFQISSWVEWKEGDFLCAYNKKYDIDEINKLEDPYRSKMAFIYNSIEKSFYEICKDYGLSIKDNSQPIFDKSFNIRRYKIGGGIGPHFDQGYDSNTSKYTLVMYLNNNFEGGEISFSLSDYTDSSKLPDIDDNYNSAKEKNEINFGIKPKAGSTIIFPSSPPYRHTAHSVISGYKYIVQLPWRSEIKEKGE